MVVDRTHAATRRIYPGPNVAMRLGAFLKRIILNMTIEPAMFLLAFSANMDDISVSQMLIYKSCKIDFGYNETICSNLVTNFTEQNDDVQDEIAQFNVYVSMVSSVFPVFFAFYLGAWCDTFGRKVCIFLFLISKIIGNLIVIAVAYFLDTPKEWYLLSLIPSALVGGFGAMSMSLNAFIADISAPDQRAFRMGMLHLASSLGRPLAPPLGAFLLAQGGFVCVTTASLLFALLSISYFYWMLRSYKWEPQKNKQRNTFSPYHIRDALVTTFKRRPGPNRKYLLILMTTMVFIIVPFFGESNISYLYVRTRYGWEVEEYTNYYSITSAAGIVGQITIIPLLSIFNIRNELACVVVILSVFLRHIVKAFAFEGWLFYVGDFVDLIGAYSMSLIRAMITCCIPMYEFGKIYAVLTAFENLIPIGVTQVYAEVWTLSSDLFPGTVFLLSAAITVIPLTLSAVVFISLKGKRLSEVTIKAEKTGSEEENEKNFEYMDIMPPSYEEATISHI